MRSYIVKESHIGLAVREILWYRQTDTQRQTSCYFNISMTIKVSPLFSHKKNMEENVKAKRKDEYKATFHALTLTKRKLYLLFC